jgi:hypothetical protein
MAAIPPWYLKACRECGIPETDIEKFIHSPFWNEFFKQVINKNGMHIFDMGQTYSGKSQKARHIAKWIVPKETLIYIDTGKPGDLQLMLTLGKPVLILIPTGTGPVRIRDPPGVRSKTDYQGAPERVGEHHQPSKLFP